MFSERLPKERVFVGEREKRSSASAFVEVEGGSTDKEVSAFVELIRSQPEAFLGEGGAGAVFRASDLNICIKFLHPHKYSQGRENGLRMLKREAEITARMNGFQFEGVRSPKCIGFFTLDESDKSGIILEELNAVNLQQALNGEEDFPAMFDPELFLEKLYAYIEEMHEEKGVVHADLYPRNIMVDKETGMPYVIDFGEAVFIESKPEEQQNKLKNKDFSLLDALDAQLMKA